MERQNTIETCSLCHEHIEIYAIGACDHSVCFKCSSRMRVLHEQMYCAICRSDLSKVIFTRHLDKYDMINTQRFHVNRRFKIFFEDEGIENAYNALMLHECKQCPNKKQLRSFSDLKDHLRREHNMHYCDLCLKHLKLFPNERKCYDRQKLGEHRRVGDADDRSHKGHPLCRFCDHRYFDNDELVKHLRKDHYFCHFCEADGVTNEFYSEYPLLQRHFAEEHYLCEEDDCAKVQFTNAFRDEIDFKAHKASMHSKNLRKQAAKQARTIDIEVNLAPRPSGGGRGGGRDRRDHNRGGANRESGEDNRSDGRRRDPRGGMSHGRQEAQRKREEIEMAQAISASLASGSAINVIDRSLLDPARGIPGSDEEAKREKYQRRTEDFPNLQGQVLQTTSETDSNPEEAPKGKPSMAKTFARSSNFSIQEDSMGTEDFPSLGNKKTSSNHVSGKSGNTVWNFKPNQSDFPVLGGSAPQPQRSPTSSAGSWNSVKPKQQQQKQRAPKKTDLSSMQDFPSLTSIGNGLLSNPIPGLAPDVPDKPVPSKKKGKVSPDFNAKPGVLQAKVENGKAKSWSSSQKTPVTKDDDKTKTPSPTVPRQNSKSQTNKREDDFPALGKPASNVEKSWGPKEKRPASQPPTKEESSFAVLKSKNKNKKKKKAISDLSDSDRGTPSQSDNEEKGKIIDSKQLKENLKTPSPVVNSADQGTTNTSKVLETAKGRTPASTALADQKSASNIPLILDDFPTLNSLQVTAPPPGFGAPAKPKGPPPGFGAGQNTAKASVKTPPPGFGANPATLAMLANSLEKTTVPPDPVPIRRGGTYIKPSNFTERNQKLIKDIQELTATDADKFQQFKTLSGKFRQGSIDASEYYQKCGEAIGMEDFLGIFSELLVLLPDIGRQQELLKVHNRSLKTGQKKEKDVLKISSKRSNKGWNKIDTSVATCPSCSQVISPSDMASHTSEHDLDSDFPALGK